MEREIFLYDVLDDPRLAEDPYFKDATFCWLIEKPACILPVRDQGRTAACGAFAATAALYGEETLNKGCSTLGSCQELVDYVPRFKNPTGRFVIPDSGSAASFASIFDYIKKHRLAPESVLPWFGKCMRPLVVQDWDRRARLLQPRIDSMGRQVLDENGDQVFDVDGVIQLEDKISMERYEKLAHYEDYTQVPPITVTEQLRMQPLAARMRFTDELRQLDGKNIYRGAGEVIGGHAVTVVGYGGEGNDAYFICQNSFGINWGYKGYLKISRRLISRFHAPYDVCSPNNRKKDDVCTLGNKRKAEAEDDTQDEAMGSQLGKRQCPAAANT